MEIINLDDRRISIGHDIDRKKSRSPRMKVLRKSSSGYFISHVKDLKLYFFILDAGISEGGKEGYRLLFIGWEQTIK